MKYKLSLFLALSFSLVADADAPPPAPVQAPKGIITPKVLPRIKGGFDFALDTSFTWWKAQVSGLSFATANDSFFSPSSHFHPGFKLGVGMDLDYEDGWDTHAEYTYFCAPWATSQYTDEETTASYSRKSQYNTIDLELGRGFFISRKLTLRPHFGAKLARLFDKAFIDEQSSFTTITAEQSRQTQTLSGIGIRAGMNTVWHVTKKLSWFGDVSLSSLWSEIHNYSYLNTHKTNDIVITQNLSRNNQTILPVIEMGIGLSYITWFRNERFQFFAKAGWEEQIWINYNYIDINGLGNNTGNLTLQGLTAQFGLVF